MLRKTILLSAITLALPGCFYAHTSQAPIATTYPISEQHKMQAAHHWQVLADNEAKGILQALNGQSVFVSGDDGSPFGQTFHQLLISELVNGGGSVMVSSNAAAEVSYDVNLIEHKDRGMIRPPEGALSVLAAGVAVATIPYNRWAEPALALIPMAVAGDMLIGNVVSESTHEIAITTRVTQQGKLLHSSTNIYYINPGDKDHYMAPEKPISTVRTIRVTDH
ncbi:hypothetical protein [Neptunomonas antarctica]|uniref:Uncharacterized protein n=1 Tax=Neptunomonas antarctica TaxID=619304 RepID=A0A1N7PN83_9GAMM|nr:hypothetical protein [Neptunomonas antarctica]SIT12026.1 hypothetical protein SAMN05421760_11712 [Neptunomonas antarctica]